MSAIALALPSGATESAFPTIDVLFESLSLINRWSGNLRFEYSALQHSILVADQMEDRSLALYGLLHETPKAFLGDPRGPVQDHFNLVGGNAYTALKSDLLAQVCASLDIPPPSLTIKSQIAAANQVIIATELRDVVRDHPGVHVRDEFPPLRKTIQPMKRVDAIIQAKIRYTMWLDDMHSALSRDQGHG